MSQHYPHLFHCRTSWILNQRLLKQKCVGSCLRMSAAPCPLSPVGSTNSRFKVHSFTGLPHCHIVGNQSFGKIETILCNLLHKILNLYVPGKLKSWPNDNALFTLLAEHYVQKYCLKLLNFIISMKENPGA